MSQPREYTFEGRMALSHGVAASNDIAAILVAEIPGAVRAFKAEKVDDLAGIDWWVETVSGRPVSVDVKVRDEDYALRNKDDLAIETWSKIENGTIGWSRNPEKRTDYILWFWRDTRRWCLVPFLMLCKITQMNWEAWRGSYKTRQQHTNGRYGNDWHSECVFVPRTVVWGEIYKHFGGSDMAQASEIECVGSCAWCNRAVFKPCTYASTGALLHNGCVQPWELAQ